MVRPEPLPPPGQLSAPRKDGGRRTGAQIPSSSNTAALHVGVREQESPARSVLSWRHRPCQQQPEWLSRTHIPGSLPRIPVNSNVKSLPFFQHLIFTFLHISHPELNNELPRCFSECCHVTVHVHRWETRTTVQVPSCTGGGQRKGAETISPDAHTDPTGPGFPDPAVEESHRAGAQREPPDTRVGPGGKRPGETSSTNQAHCKHLN